MFFKNTNILIRCRSADVAGSEGSGGASPSPTGLRDQERSASPRGLEHPGTSIEHLLTSMKMMERKRTSLHHLFHLPRGKTIVFCLTLW